MIQELLVGGGGGLLMEEKKITTSSLILMNTTTPSTTTTTPSHSTTSSTITSEPQQNLRCPRCDSSNTKFCYYNNYNLTQPRHFCKTCRRYWTKGGALRNVPIGGGCRKAKPSPSSLSSASKSATNKLRSTNTAAALAESTVLGNLNNLRGSINLWPPASHTTTSNLMALLRSTRSSTTPEALPLPANPNPSRIKEEEEGGLMMGSFLVPPDSTLVANALNARTSLLQVALDPVSQEVPNDDPFSSLWKSSTRGHYLQYHQQQQQAQQGVVLAEAPISSGIHELYQKLRGNYHNNVGNAHGGGMGNVGSSCPSAAASSAAVCTATGGGSILEPTPLGGGSGDQLGGYWNNSPLAWSDHIPAPNGAFP